MDYRTAPEPQQPDRSLLIVGLRGHVYALDRATGQMRWHNPLPGGGIREVTLAIGFGVVVASAYGGIIYCLDYLTGQLRWQHDTQHAGRATILLEPDHIVCAKSGSVDCYAPDGRLLWMQPLQGAGFGPTAVGYPGNVMQADDPGSE